MKQYPASQKMTGIVTRNLDAFQYFHASITHVRLTRGRSTAETCWPYCSTSLVRMVVVGTKHPRVRLRVPLFENRGNCFSSLGWTRPTPHRRSLQRCALLFGRGSARGATRGHPPFQVFVRNSRSKFRRVPSLRVEPSNPAMASHHGRHYQVVVVRLDVQNGSQRTPSCLD